MDDTTSVPDLLRGLPAVAAHLGVTLRQARYWQTRELLPTFKIGELICARRSTLTAWLAAAEARGKRSGKVVGDAHADDADHEAAA